jgi:histone H3/H4
MRNARSGRRHDDGPIPKGEIDRIVRERMQTAWMVMAVVSIALLIAHVFWPALEAAWRAVL